MELNKLVSTLNMEHSTWLKYRRKGSRWLRCRKHLWAESLFHSYRSIPG